MSLCFEIRRRSCAAGSRWSASDNAPTYSSVAYACLVRITIFSTNLSTVKVKTDHGDILKEMLEQYGTGVITIIFVPRISLFPCCRSAITIYLLVARTLYTLHYRR